MPQPTQAHRFLQISSNLGKDALIATRASGGESLSWIFEIQVEFTAARDDLDLDVLLGTPVTLKFEMAGELGVSAKSNPRCFHGCSSWPGKLLARDHMLKVELSSSKAGAFRWMRSKSPKLHPPY